MTCEATGLAPRRLHPAGIAVLAVRSLRDLALPLGIAFATAVFGSGGQPVTRAVIFGAIGAVLAAAAGILGWLTTRWSVGDGTIRLRTGVVSEKVTDVPLRRVQALDIVHGPLQRLFGIQGVHVQTAGGGKAAEITLPALTAPDVELLRAAVRGGEPAVTEAPAELDERRLSRGELLLAVLTAGQIGVILPLLAAVPQLADELWGGDIGRAGREGMEIVPGSALEWILAVAVLLGAAWLVAVGGAVVAFAGFRVARDGDRLRIRRGFLAQRDATVPVARVQAVQVIEGVLRQPFGLVALRVEVAGYAKEAAAAQTLFPLLRRAEVEPFLAEFLPELADHTDGLEGAPRRALRRYMLPPASLALVAGVVAGLLLSTPWPLLVVVPATWYGVEAWRAAGWRLGDGRVVLRFRRMARITVLAPVARLQQHGLRQTVFQRRAALAGVSLRVGAGTRGEVRHLDASVAGSLFDALRRTTRL